MKIFERVKNFPLIRLFSLAIIFSFILWLVNLFCGSGNPLFWGRMYPCDSIFDDFTCLTAGVRDFLPYESLFPSVKAGFSYPPNAYLFFAILGNIIYKISPEKFENAQILFASFYLTACISALYILIFNFIKNIKVSDKVLFLSAISLSGVMLASYERTNVIFITLFLLSFFIFYHNSENKIIKEISLIALSTAISFKLSPAIFGLFLIYNKDFKAVLRLIFYTVLLFVIPSLFFTGGVVYGGVLKTFVENLTSFSESIVDGAQVIGIGKEIISLIVMFFSGCSLAQASAKTATFLIACGFVGLLTSFFYPEKWKKALLLVSMMIIIPSVSYLYTFVYFIPVMALYFMEENHSKQDKLFVLWFIIMFWTAAVSIRGSYYNYIIAEIGFLGMFFQIVFYGVKSFLQALKNGLISIITNKINNQIEKINRSQIKKNYCKKILSVSVTCILLSIVFFVFGITVMHVNYPILKVSKTENTIDKPITLQSDFRISIDTVFVTKNMTGKIDTIFQTAMDNKGLSLNIFPDNMIVFAYPYSEEEGEISPLGEAKPNTKYRFQAEITNNTMSLLLSEYSIQKNKWMPYYTKPVYKSIMPNVIQNIVFGTETGIFNGQIQDFRMKIINGNKSNLIVYLILISTFIPLFVIAYYKRFRRMLKTLKK